MTGMIGEVVSAADCRLTVSRRGMRGTDDGGWFDCKMAERSPDTGVLGNSWMLGSRCINQGSPAPELRRD